MSNNAMWYRRDNEKLGVGATQEHYFKLLFGKNFVLEELNFCQDPKNTNPYCKKIENALREAHEIRRFEISLFWKRAQFFWIFIGIVFAAYGGVLFSVIAPSTTDSKVFVDNIKYAILTLLNFVGLIMTYIWYEIIRGSKYWQENWEKHIDMLEEHVTGHLHKVMHKSEGQIFSVSKPCKLLAQSCFVLWCMGHMFCTFVLENSLKLPVLWFLGYIGLCWIGIAFIRNITPSSCIKKLADF